MQGGLHTLLVINNALLLIVGLSDHHLSVGLGLVAHSDEGVVLELLLDFLFLLLQSDLLLLLLLQEHSPWIHQDPPVLPILALAL